MKAREIIDSGILEAYVLGQAGPVDARLVEQMRTTEPAVDAELDAIEAALEHYAMQLVVQPKAGLKDSVLAAINKKVDVQDVPVREMPIAGQAAALPRMNWLIAASITGLVVSAGLNVVQYSRLQNVKEELARLENDRSVLAQELQVQRTSLERSNEQLAVVSDPRARIIQLDGIGAAQGRNARIYWDQQEHLVHFDVLALPPPPEGKQYQLWALLDGKPIDAGMIDLEGGVGLQRMKDVPMAQAFAVTIEQIGGSPTPDLTALVLMGQV